MRPSPKTLIERLTPAPRRALALLCAMFSLIIIAATAAGSKVYRDQVMADVRRHAQHATGILEERVRGVLAAAEITRLCAAEAVAAVAAGRHAREDLSALLDHIGKVVPSHTIRLHDGVGAATEAAVRFRPVAPSGGAGGVAFTVSHRIEGPDGRIGGSVVTAVAHGALADVLTTLPNGSSLELFRGDGELLFQAGSPDGDGAEPIVSRRGIADHGLTLNAAIPNGEVRRLAESFTATVAQAAAGAIGTVWLLFGVAWTSARRAERAMAVKHLSNRRLKNAVVRLNQARKDAESANLAKSRLLAAITHDLHQPLTACHLFLRRAATSSGGEARELIEKASTAVEMLSQMLRTLIEEADLGGPQGAAPDLFRTRVVDVLHAVHLTFAEAAAEKGLELRVVHCDLAVRSEPFLLRRALSNLVANAVDYTEAGKVLVGCRRRGDLLEFQVWDTGPGIPEARIPDLFQEYRRYAVEKAQLSAGLGLGLTVVRDIAQTLGHSLDVRSVVGKGSCFSLGVPIAEALPSQREALTA